MVDWPDPLTVPDAVRDLKDRFIASFQSEGEESEKVRDLNYIVAVSSGKAVTEDIPKQIGRRAGWASQQGANFVEILIENPSQLVMDQDMLVNLADRLDLHYNIHSSTNLAYGMSYRVGRGNGYDSAHEYTVKLLKAIRRFRGALETHDQIRDANGQPRLYAINGHMAVAQFPPEEERLATDVSVDPYGQPIEESKIFECTEARLGIWRHFIWDFLGIGNDLQDFARVMNLFEETRDIQDFVRSNLVDLLADDGYISDDQLKAIKVLRDEGLEGQIPELQRLRNLPTKVSDLKRHINGRGLAQQAATTNIRDIVPDRFEDDIAEILEENGIGWPGTRVLDLSAPKGEGSWDEYETRAQDRVMQTDSEAFQEVEKLLGAKGSYSEEDAIDAMHKVARMRLLHDDFNKESSIFRHIIPLWMPFTGEEQVRQIWENITDTSFDDHTDAIDWLYEGDQAMNRPRDEEDVVAAATGAYVWGHFTQVPPGYEQDGPLVQLLEDAGVFFSFESHMAGPAENARIWKPKDMVEVVKAINTTPIEVDTEDGTTERTFDRTRITIDMEHIATQKVDPMWVVDPDPDIAEREGYKGLDDGDGRYIMINHVTHPYIGEQQHHHGPVRRGDTLVYRYIHKLIEKGMCTDDIYPTIVMYEIGGEKAETIFMLRLILNMIEHGIEPEELEGPGAAKIINKDEPDGLKEYLIQKFFGVTDTEVQHEWQEIFEHALDPLDELLEGPSGSHTWMGRAATESGTRPEEWEGEKYR